MSISLTGNYISMRVFFLALLLLVVFTFNNGCGPEEEDNKRPKRRNTDTQQIKQDPEDNSSKTTPSTTLPTPSQAQALRERYNKLKSLAPAPDISQTTVCTKTEQTTKNITSNEYSSSQPLGTALLCDWLENETMRNFATFNKNFCREKAQEKIEELKKEGYTCSTQQ